MSSAVVRRGSFSYDSSVRAPRRIVVLGTGTGVGKTYASCQLVRRFVAEGQRVLALKPIESGLNEAQLQSSDAGRLAQECGQKPRHFQRFLAPLSPHLAAREQQMELQVDEIAAWVHDQENAFSQVEQLDLCLIETAGGVFSPLSPTKTNWDLAWALDQDAQKPCEWILVAPDSLGVLHDVSACLLALHSKGRRPDRVILSAARPPDASTGKNAQELEQIVFPALGAAAPRNSQVETLRFSEGQETHE